MSTADMGKPHARSAGGLARSRYRRRPTRGTASPTGPDRGPGACRRAPHAGLYRGSGPAYGVRIVVAPLGPAPGRTLLEYRIEHVLAERFLGQQRNRVRPVEACCAQPGRRLLRPGDHPGGRDVAERIRPDAAAHPLDQVRRAFRIVRDGRVAVRTAARTGVVRDELRGGSEVYAVETGPSHRRRGDAHVD